MYILLLETIFIYKEISTVYHVRSLFYIHHLWRLSRNICIPLLLLLVAIGVDGRCQRLQRGSAQSWGNKGNRMGKSLQKIMGTYCEIVI